MSDSDESYIELRSRRVNKHSIPVKSPTTSITRTSTPVHSLSPSLENISRSIQESTRFYKELSNRVDRADRIISVQNFSTLFPSLVDPSIHFIMEPPHPPVYNKEIADLMATNIPKFELDSSTNPALELRAFIKSCENVLNLFPDNEEANEEFFKLIKFRLGYNVQERVTIDKFESLQDLETHLRSVCHLKLNKGKLLSEIRHERQLHNEDVSHFVERLRKLIAQGRSEYSNDKEFEREAIHTLKNSVKSELISIKLMDSKANKFEELAEIAINRDLELHQRSYNITKPEKNVSQDLINDLIQKIKNLEAKQTANIQHIRQESRFNTNPPKNTYNGSSRLIQRSPYCGYCQRSGHDISECRSKNRNNQRNFDHTNFKNSNNRQNYYPQSGNNLRSRSYSPVFVPRNDYQRYNFARNSQNQHSPQQDYRNAGYSRNHSSNFNENYQERNDQRYTNQHFRNNPITCVRCNQSGHKSNSCYEIICSICKQFGHTHSQCQQSSNHRRVQFIECTQHNEDPRDCTQSLDEASIPHSGN